MALVWLFALGVVFIRRIPFGLVFGPLFLLYGASGLVFREDEDGPLQWSEWLAPLLAIGFLLVGTVLTAASLALLALGKRGRPWHLRIASQYTSHWHGRSHT